LILMMEYEYEYLMKIMKEILVGIGMRYNEGD